MEFNVGVKIEAQMAYRLTYWILSHFKRAEIIDFSPFICIIGVKN